MKTFEFLPHTADAKFKAYGKTLEELLTNASAAIVALMTNGEAVKSVKTQTINFVSPDEENLVIDFLNEIIFIIEVEHFFPAKKGHNITISKQNNQLYVKAELKGDLVKNYETHGHVKSATYNDFYLKKLKDGYETQIVVDL